MSRVYEIFVLFDLITIVPKLKKTAARMRQKKQRENFPFSLPAFLENSRELKNYTDVIFQLDLEQINLAANLLD